MENKQKKGNGKRKGGSAVAKAARPVNKKKQNQGNGKVNEFALRWNSSRTEGKRSDAGKKHGTGGKPTGAGIGEGGIRPEAGKREVLEKKRMTDGRNAAGRRWESDRKDTGGRRYVSEDKKVSCRRQEAGKETMSGKKNRAGKMSDVGKRHGGMKKNGTLGVPKEVCPVYKKCGGCQGQAEPYSSHLKNKQLLLEKVLGDFCTMEPIIGMKEPYHYRNKVHAVFDHDRKGNPICGVYEENSHNVVPVENCRIEDARAGKIMITIRDLLKSFKIRTYDEDNGTGLLRHVLIRTGYKSGEVMVVLVLSSPILPSKNNFVKALRKVHPEITTIVINVNGKDTSMVLGEKEQVIYGKGFIEDTLCDKVFRISPKSFYQVNPVQTEILYNKAMEFAGLTGKETVLDTYCGIGTIGIIAAAGAKKVIGVELNRDAVKDAVLNAKRNGVKNIRFYQNDAGEFMEQVASANDLNVDVVFMDPPRSGSTELFMDALARLKPERVVYVSCNPVTLVRDLKYLIRKGYGVKKGMGVDLFPWTNHVECVCLLTRNK